MFDPAEIYRLNTDHVAETFGDAAMLLKKRDYIGRILFTGDDAAIEIAGGKVVTIVAGQPNHDNERFRDMVEARRKSLLAAFDEIAEPTTARFVIAGIWHKGSHPHFTPYVIHEVDAAGETRTRKYDLRVLPYDEQGDGPIVRIRLYDTDGVNAHMQLRYVTEAEIDLDERLKDATGPEFIQGMVWYPDPKTWKFKLPIIVCRAQGKSKCRNTVKPLNAASDYVAHRSLSIGVTPMKLSGELAVSTA